MEHFLPAKSINLVVFLTRIDIDMDENPDHSWMNSRFFNREQWHDIQRIRTENRNM